MAPELTYALITPYSLSKSRTGGIISRMLTLTEDLELVAARMYAPSDEFVDRYVDVIEKLEKSSEMTPTFVDYVSKNLRPGNPKPGGNRCLVLFMKGENATDILKHNAVGSAMHSPSGDTVRGAYGDYIQNEDGTVRYFEPAVIIAREPEANRAHLELFREYAVSDGGNVEKAVRFPEGTRLETTLVILKPDNFMRQSSRPGNIIDMFSRTGLRIVGAKLFNMSVAQGEEFYGPLVDIFRARLRFLVTNRLRSLLSDAFDFTIDDDVFEKMTDMLAEKNALCEFGKIVEYMTGINPQSVRELENKKWPGAVQCLALLYRGEDAVRKIRERLGATDPSKAAATTVRSSFGHDLMKNAAHASDSVESAIRERRIVGMLDDEGEPEVVKIIAKHFQYAGE